MLGSQMRYYKGHIFCSANLFFTLFSYWSHFLIDHTSCGIPAGIPEQHCPCVSSPFFVWRGRATDTSLKKDNYFSEWKETKQGLDNMLHAVLLIKFDEFIVILYQQEKISFIG